MNEERKVIESNTIVVFEQPTTYASKLNELLKDFHGDVVINGDLSIDEELRLKCNLYVTEDIESNAGKDINIEGDLECWGFMDTYDVSVKGCFHCDCRIDSTDIMVGENFSCDEEVKIGSSDITVAGDFECESVESGKIYVLGKVKVETDIEAEGIKIGY